MPWEVEYTDAFESWWRNLSEEQQVALDAMVRVLEHHGAALGPPYSVDVPSVNNPNVRQLQIPCEEQLLCVLYLADEWRQAFVLLAGATGQDVCPPELGDEAEIIYQSYVELRRRGRD